MAVHRLVLRLTRQGVHIADVQTVDQLAEHVDLAPLAEDDPAAPDPPR